VGAEIDLSQVPRPVLGDSPGLVALNAAAWQMAARHVRVSRGRPHIDAAWDAKRNYQWVWDTCFMALYARYAPHALPAMGGLDNFYELQRDDGYIAMTYDMDAGTEPWPNRVNPPLFAWAEWEYARTTGDLSRLARAAAHSERFMEWLDANRRTAPHARRRAVAGARDDYQLYWFEDCGSSGMDDSPRTPRTPEAGRHFDWIDLSSQVALSFRCLARIHGALGDTARAAAWETRARDLGALINDELWCERSRFYHDRTLPRNFVSCKTVAGLWPILAGFCTGDRLDALVEHLRNPAEFARRIPVPSLSADDPNFSPEGRFWRGGVWASAVYMVVRGLAGAGRAETAAEIATAYVEGLRRVYDANEPHTLWECCAPDRDEPGLKPYGPERVKPDFVGWSALGPIAMLVENVVGLDADALAGAVQWTITRTDEHGVRGLPVGPGTRADLLCRARAGVAAPVVLSVRSERAFTLSVRAGEREVVERVPAGREVTVTA
jgi:glycogen debranching enzyme